MESDSNKVQLRLKTEPVENTKNIQTIEILIKEIVEKQFVKKPTLTELFDKAQKDDIIIIEVLFCKNKAFIRS